DWWLLEAKVLRVAEDGSSYTLMTKMPPGTRLPTHRHLGPVSGFTFQGTWRYLEYDWAATEGSFIYEPPGSVHTLVVEGDVPAIVIFEITGGLVLFDENDNVVGYEDAESARDRYRMALEAKGQRLPSEVL
ncbi:MAG: 2,4'-dihydroxyacetophenone dioxygenase family protein, partial [Actinomycetota bacterium]